MKFPKFDTIDFVGKPLGEWLTSLPEGSTLRVFHTIDENIKTTWLEWKEGNVMYVVSMGAK